MIDSKTKALLKASALVGYCESVKGMQFDSPEGLQKWLERLFKYTEATGLAIAAIWAEPSEINQRDAEKYREGNNGSWLKL